MLTLLAMPLLSGVTESLSNFANVPLGKQVKEMDISPQFDAYSGVEIIIDTETSVFAGNRSGRVLQIKNAWGTQAQAQNILNSLTRTGFQYQPYTASGAILNPAAEIGDGVTINGIYSGLYRISRRYGSLADADIEAPQDEEINHEYPYEPKEDREITRKFSAIESEFRIQSNEIAAKVSETGGNDSSVGWSLTSTAWTVKANGQEVFRINSSGASVTGVIRATSGVIGGFTIGAHNLWNTIDNIDNAAALPYGVYIGTDGIRLGANFKVDSGGNISAVNANLSGTLTIGGSTITAVQLRSGAYSAFTNGSYWSTGAGYANNYNNATKSGTSSYPSYFTAGYIIARSRLDASAINCSSGLTVSGRFYFGGYSAAWRAININGTIYNVLVHY